MCSDRTVFDSRSSGGMMVITLRASAIADLASKGIMPSENWKPEVYMATLRDSGFTDVRMEDKQDSLIMFQAIYATASKCD